MQHIREITLWNTPYGQRLARMTQDLRDRGKRACSIGAMGTGDEQ